MILAMFWARHRAKTVKPKQANQRRNPNQCCIVAALFGTVANAEQHQELVTNSMPFTRMLLLYFQQQRVAGRYSAMCLAHLMSLSLK